MSEQEQPTGSAMAPVIKNAHEQSQRSLQLCADSREIIARTRRTRETNVSRRTEMRLDRKQIRSLLDELHQERATLHSKAGTAEIEEADPVTTTAASTGEAGIQDVGERAQDASLEILFLAKSFQEAKAGFYRIECIVEDSVCLCRCDEKGHSVSEDLDALVCLSVIELENFLISQEAEAGIP
jgi:hypothetical protein